MNQSLIAIALMVLGPAFAFAQSNGAQEVEITAEPSHHLVLENEYVRVFSVSVAPHTATLMHRHRHDYVFVTLGDARISNEVEGKEAVEAVLSDGTTRFTAGNFAHIARNLGDTPFRNVTIEILKDQKGRSEPKHWDKDSGEETSLGWNRKILFVKDGVRVSQVELDAKARLPKGHGEGPALLVAVNDCELEPNADVKGSAAKTLKAGEFWWSDGASAVVNTGTGPARFVVLEF
jgi:hypothetical protein